MKFCLTLQETATSYSADIMVASQDDDGINKDCFHCLQFTGDCAAALELYKVPFKFPLFARTCDVIHSVSIRLCRRRAVAWLSDHSMASGQ